MHLKKGQGAWRISDIAYTESLLLSGVLESRLRDWKPAGPTVTNKDAVKRLYDDWLAENRKGIPNPEMTAAFVERHRDLLAPKSAELLLEALRASAPLVRNPFCNGVYRMMSYEMGADYGDSFVIHVRREGADGRNHVQGLMVDAGDGMVTNVVYGPPDGNLLDVCRKRLGRSDEPEPEPQPEVEPESAP